MTQFALSLLLAHLLGDFVFQPSAWVEDKERKKAKSIYLWVHVIIHGLLTLFFVQSWPIASIVAVSHALIDLAKLYGQTDATRRRWFFLDQALHLAILAGIVIWRAPELDIPVVLNWLREALPVMTGALFLTTPSSALIKTAISRWRPTIDDQSSVSLDQAGAYIGILERLFVFTFVINGQWDAVGFLIAAKSVFRFGDLKDSSELKLTEYILIGTLLSVGLASIVAALVRAATAA
ncbi:DUF3307 domain-containing protein [Rhodothermus sp. AH-315-K08]|nr:DUF3307 domain-containing protein [Rhodothermus sp. AH-315-K08]